jgi:hypothetical protein
MRARRTPLSGIKPGNEHGLLLKILAVRHVVFCDNSVSRRCPILGRLDRMAIAGSTVNIISDALYFVTDSGVNHATLLRRNAALAFTRKNQALSNAVGPFSFSDKACRKNQRAQREVLAVRFDHLVRDAAKALEELLFGCVSVIHGCLRFDM